eukprot:9058562-Lingulodinium_polyedra.AAC.1
MVGPSSRARKRTRYATFYEVQCCASSLSCGRSGPSGPLMNSKAQRWLLRLTSTSASPVPSSLESAGAADQYESVPVLSGLGPL